MADNPQIQAEKLLKYGKKQLLDKGVTAQPTTLREVLDNISNVETGGDYDIVKITKPNGNQKWIVTTVTDGERPKDMLQAMVDATNSCKYLLANYLGTELDISRLNTSNVTNMDYMFNGCYKLTNLDVSSINTSNVTTMKSMFAGCEQLKSLDVSNFDTSKVTDMGSMFDNLRVVKTLDISNFDTSKVTNMWRMFGLWDATNLDVSKLNTSKVTNMGEMFNSCSELTTLDLSNFDTSNVTNISRMFTSCSKLTTINGVIDLINANSVGNMFQYCQEIVDFIFKNIKKTLQLGSGTSYGTKLSDNTIINTFQELHDLTGTTAQTLTLSTPSNARTEAIYVKLIEPTEEMIANDPYITNKKPCVICESTDEGAMTLKEYGIIKNWNIA